MASWIYEQRERLVYEEKLLSKELPHFKFYDRTQSHLTTVRGYHTTAANNKYALWLRLGKAFPYEVPGLYVTFPSPLYGRGGRTIQSYGTSHYMHTWKPDWNDYVKICHWKEEFWTTDNTVLSVILKGFLWLEAYEVYRRGGSAIESLSLPF